MTLGLILLVLLAFFTFYNNGIQAYIHFEAYPLLSSVGTAEKAAYLNAYERLLTIPLLVPYILTLIINLALIFVRPDDSSAVWFIIAILLNLAVSITTARVATPVYKRIKEAAEWQAADLAELMKINWIRLGISTVSSLWVMFILLQLLDN